jgi:hypothetical protein
MTNELKAGPSSLPTGFRFVFGGFLAAALLLVWIPQYLPLTDYPEHLLVIQVLSHYNDPGTQYVRDYAVKMGNVPYVSIYVLGMMLNRLLPIFAVGKVLLSLYIIFTPLSVLGYVRSIRNISPWSSLLSFAFLFNLFYYLGSLNFLISIPLSFLALSLILGLLHKPMDRTSSSNQSLTFSSQYWRPVTLAVVFIALFYTHFVSFAAVMLVAMGLGLAAKVRGQSIVSLAISMVPSLALAGISILKGLSASAPALGASWLPLPSRLFDLLQPFLIYRDDYFHRTVVDKLSLPLLALAAGWFVISLVSLIKGRFGSRSSLMEGETGVHPDAWLVILIFLFSALVFPSQIPSASFAHRLSILVLLSFCGILPKQFGGRTPTKGILVAVTFFAFVVSGWRAADFNREMKPFLSATKQMHADARVLPLIQNLHSARLRTYCFLHILNYYHLEKGGSNPYLLFRNMPQIPVHYRFLDELPSVGSFEPDLFDWDMHHDRYRYFLARDASARVMNQLRAHTRLIFESEGWSLYEAEGSLGGVL